MFAHARRTALLLALLLARGTAVRTNTELEGAAGHDSSEGGAGTRHGEELCVQAHVDEACGLLAWQPSPFVSAGSLQAALGASEASVAALLQRLGPLGVGLRCLELCKRLVNEVEAWRLPPRPDVGCRKGPENVPICDIDLSPDALAALQTPSKRDLPNFHDRESEGEPKGNNELVPGLSGDNELPDVPLHDLLRKVANLFRIYPFLTARTLSNAQGGAIAELGSADLRGSDALPPSLEASLAEVRGASRASGGSADGPRFFAYGDYVRSYFELEDGSKSTSTETGIVEVVRKDQVSVRFDDSVQQWVEPSYIVAVVLRKGDLVAARYTPYSLRSSEEGETEVEGKGIVGSVSRGSAAVRFEGNVVRTLPAGDVQEVLLRPGDRVEAHYYLQGEERSTATDTGSVKSLSRDFTTILFDDEVQQTVPMSFVVRAGIRVGDKVKTHFINGNDERSSSLDDGIIQSLNMVDGSVDVLFPDDGAEQKLPFSFVRGFWRGSSFRETLGKLPTAAMDKSTAWEIEARSQQAQAYVTTALRKLGRYQTKDDIKKWFGEKAFLEFATRNEIKRVLNSLDGMLANVAYVYPGPGCSEDTFAYVYGKSTFFSKNPEGQFVFYLCDLYLKSDKSVQIEVLTHEGSHHATAYTKDMCSNGEEDCDGDMKAYGRSTCQTLATKHPEAAVKNADNFCYYINDVNGDYDR